MEIDKSNMRKIILDFPRQFQIGVKAAQKVHLKPGTILHPLENVIVCGMGGSGLPGGLLASLRPLDVFTHKSYGLPIQAGIGSLIVCVSYSGNTEETLSAFKEALDKKLALIAISRGGKLAQLAQKHRIPLVKLPKPNIPPRLALVEMFAALLQVLANHDILSQNFVNDFLAVGLRLKTKEIKKQGKKLAQKFFQKVPLIYVPELFQEVGLIWKNSLNETAKVLAICNHFPELNHNETVGLWKINEMQISNDKLYVLILRDPKSHPRILKQMKISQDLIKEEGIEVESINMKGDTLLEKFFSTILLGFWTSFHLALLYKVDPTPVKMIDEFKRRLAKEKDLRYIET